MDRDKLIDIITDANAFYVTDKDDIGFADRYEMSSKLADHLMANGIGDISAENARLKANWDILCNKFGDKMDEMFDSAKLCEGRCYADALGIVNEIKNYDGKYDEKLTAEKHRADVAEEALRELIAEMYENGIRPICNQEMLYDTRLEQAEQRIKERK